jgi:hypothetical protein
MNYKVIVPEYMSASRDRIFIISAENEAHAKQIVDENYTHLISTLTSGVPVLETHEINDATILEDKE